MKLTGTCNQRAFNFIELMVVLSVVALVIITIILVPQYYRSKQMAARINCGSNLKLIALSFKMFAGDNDQRFPFNATNSPATQNTSNAWQHFLALSNELGSTRLLMCPQDVSRYPTMAYSFGSETNGLSTLQNQAVSYFMGLDADEANRDMVLAGDRNLAIPGQQASNNLLTISGTNRLQWNHRLHANKGYAALSDGSVSFTASNFPVWKDHTNRVRLLLPN
jgi:competence protein ComGC